ncbi:hypothetical protein BDY21DRAFT_300199 [Lineolata rhizophorae]|uniref:Ran-interacting Mog1 protein n=1 Tax=Lineolata rhizophorae TaxID=578093 RepID=A0A6A6P650_9PEZI|nr:hypothetical protein BDY21DRAFT_300199 [Lineolata rhizophorae]
MASFTSRELFGGAMTVSLPSEFADVSSIRQVPDNQEVWLDTNGFTSIIFDITERVDEQTASSDEDAMKFHFADIASGSNDDTKIWTAGSAQMTKLPTIPAYTMFATQTPPEGVRTGCNPTPDFTGIMLVLLRLKEQQTDLVITVNVPHTPGEYNKEEVDPSAGKNGPLLNAGLAARQKILETFEIKDLSLFVN